MYYWVPSCALVHYNPVFTCPTHYFPVLYYILVAFFIGYCCALLNAAVNGLVHCSDCSKYFATALTQRPSLLIGRCMIIKHASLGTLRIDKR